VHEPEKAIAIQLRDEHSDKLVVEVTSQRRKSSGSVKQLQRPYPEECAKLSSGCIAPGAAAFRGR